MNWWIDFAHEFAVQFTIKAALAFVFYYGAIWLWSRSRAWYRRNI